MKRLTLTTAIALALCASPVTAGPAPGGNWLSAADIATHLAENGFRVLKLERESDGFEAELADRQGNLLEARVNPATAALISTHTKGRAATPANQWLTFAQVARQLENKGFLIRTLETEPDGYEAELTDQAGARTEVRIAPTTGEIVSSQPD